MNNRNSSEDSLYDFFSFIYEVWKCQNYNPGD